MKFEKPNKLEPEDYGPLQSDETIFNRYVSGLGLSPEDFKKKILDVGAGRAQFARYAKEHHISNKIFTVDPYAIPMTVSEQRPKSVAGIVQELPFKDGSFDLVVSCASVPMIFSDIGEGGEVAEEIYNSLKEELRVLKRGGELRFGPIPAAGTDIREHEILNQELYYILHELENSGQIQVDIVPQEKRPTKEKLDQWYLIKIKKLK